MSSDQPQLPKIFQRQVHRECASELRRQTRQMLHNASDQSQRSASVMSASRTPSAKTSMCSQRPSDASLNYLQEVRKSSYYDRKEQRERQQEKQRQLEQQRRAVLEQQEEAHRQKFEERVTQLMQKEGCLKPLLDSSYFLKGDFYNKSFSELSRDEFVEREIKLATFLRKIEEYNRYAAENETANVQYQKELEELEQYQSRYKRQLDDEITTISNSISSLKKKSEILSEQISVAKAQQTAIANKKEQMLVALNESVQILREYIESRDTILEVCQLKQYKRFSQLWKEDYEAALSALEHASEMRTKPVKTPTDEFGMLIDNFALLRKYSNFYLNRNYFQKHFPGENSPEELSNSQQERLLGDIMPKYFSVAENEKVSLLATDEKSKAVRTNQEVVNILKLMKSISCFQGTKLRYEKEQEASQENILKQYAPYNYGHEIECLAFLLPKYKNTNSIVVEAVQQLMAAVQPAFIPFKSVDDAKKLIESFYFNTQLLQDQIDHNAHTLIQQSAEYKDQCEQIQGLEDVSQNKSYQELRRRLDALKCQYIQQLNFYDILQFKDSQEHEQQVALLKHVGQYKNILGMDCKVKDQYALDTGFLYSYQDFQTSNQMVLQQLEDQFEYIKQACNTIGSKHGLYMDPIDLLKYVDMKLGKMLKKISKANHNRLRDCRKAIRNEFIKGLDRKRPDNEVDRYTLQGEQDKTIDVESKQEALQRFNCHGNNLAPNRHITLKNLHMRKLVAEQQLKSQMNEKSSTQLYYDSQ